MQDVTTKVREYIVENFLMGEAGSKIKDDDSFLDHHIIDSTGFIELVSFLEDTYKIAIKDEEMIPENLDSLSSINSFVTGKLK